MSWSGLLGGRLAALAAGCLVLSGGAALLGIATAAVRLFAAVLRRVGRVGDPGGARLRHALVLERLVLILVLDVGGFRRHRRSPWFERLRVADPPGGGHAQRSTARSSSALFIFERPLMPRSRASL